MYSQKKVGFQYLFYTVFLFFILSCEKQPFEVIGEPLEPMSINGTPINRIHITINEEDLEYLFINCFEHGVEYERSCTFSALINGKNVEIQDCGLRIHGGYSRRLPKKSFRVYFKKNPFVSEDLFKGFPTQFKRSNEFSQIVLSADLLDYSHIRNYISMYFSNKIGCFTPRITFVWLDINDTHYGLYSVIERINKDYCRQLFKHEDFDLLKAANYNANFKSTDWKTREPKEIQSGFEIKKGSIEPFENFVKYIESNSFNFTEVCDKVTQGLLYSYFTSAYITDDNDAFFYNYYLLHDRSKNHFSIVRWDADITYDRPRNIQKHISLKNQLEKNGLYEKLGRTNWKDEIKIFIEQKLKTDFKESKQLAIVDSLDLCLREYAIKDITMWWDELETWFQTETGDDDYYLKKYSQNTCHEIYEDNITLINEFIKSRSAEINSELINW